MGKKGVRGLKSGVGVMVSGEVVGGKMEDRNNVLRRTESYMHTWHAFMHTAREKNQCMLEALEKAKGRFEDFFFWEYLRVSQIDGSKRIG